MERKILGIDPGTANCGYGLLTVQIGDQPSDFRAEITDFGLWKSSVRDGDVRKRIDTLGDHARRYACDKQVTNLSIEDFTEQGVLVGKTYKEMSWLVEHLRGIGAELHLSTDVYANAVWKQQLLHARQASKQMVKHFVEHRIAGADKLAGQPDHVYDAVAIAYCTFIAYKQAAAIRALKTTLFEN